MCYGITFLTDNVVIIQARSGTACIEYAGKYLRANKRVQSDAAPRPGIGAKLVM